MGRIASFHLVRTRHASVALANLGADRLRLRSVPGLELWRVLGTGRGRDTGPSADLGRTALFAVWRDERDLDAFLAGSSIARRWAGAEEQWHVRLRGLGGHGSWRGFDVLGGLERGADSGPIAVITRADVHVRAWRDFRAVGRPVSLEVQRAQGLLAVAGIGELPVGRLGTFSLWSGLPAIAAFAGQPRHREVVRRTRNEHWYGEELFARFEPYGSSGTWDGRDPLAPDPH
ncbi:MAG: spheroidene monooxygenase [Ilumatobacteraceae bacterium]